MIEYEEVKYNSFLFFVEIKIYYEIINKTKKGN